MTKARVIAARRYLTKLGYVEDSGQRRPDPTGRMLPVYRVSALGFIAKKYVDRGLTWEDAMEFAKASLK